MKIALVGATGNAGSRILAEFVRRGHAVTAVSRSPEKTPALPGVTPAKGDADHPEALAGVLAGHDAVVSAVHFSASDPDKLIAAVRASGVKRYLVVGGAGSLEVAPGVKLFDTPQFPALYLGEAKAGGRFLDILRASAGDLEWSFLSPSAMFVPGERTGRFRLGGDQLLTTEDGSSISFEDFAIALVDEIEAPKHVGRRFTVGY
jgi:putative NADH-flavin reductase